MCVRLRESLQLWFRFLQLHLFIALHGHSACYLLSEDLFIVAPVCPCGMFPSPTRSFHDMLWIVRPSLLAVTRSSNFRPEILIVLPPLPWLLIVCILQLRVVLSFPAFLISAYVPCFLVRTIICYHLPRVFLNVCFRFSF